MSTFRLVDCTCAVCKQTNEYHILASTNAFGSCDLDTRPPEMSRSTMPAWIQVCPNCGYISERIDDDTSITAEFLKTPEYLSCNGVRFKSTLAISFYRYYMINLQDDKPRDAFFAILHAAWVCDDAEDTESAKECRKLAIPLLAEFKEADPERAETLSLIRADLMRRSSLFEELKAEYTSITYSEDLMNKILVFELQLANRKDDKCYKVSDIPES